MAQKKVIASGYNIMYCTCHNHYAYSIITTLINAVQQKKKRYFSSIFHFRSDFQDVSIREIKKKAFEMLLKTDDYMNQT